MTREPADRPPHSSQSDAVPAMTTGRASTLFPELLGGDYVRLPAAVRAFHDTPLPARFHGRARIRAATRWPARLAARVAGLPRADADVALTVDVEHRDGGEFWRRDFAGTIMHSTLVRHGGLLRERLGWLRFQFQLIVNAAGIDWQVRSVHLFGLPLPVGLFRAVRAREYELDGRYRFEIDAGLPLFGHVVAYDGWLEPQSQPPR